MKKYFLKFSTLITSAVMVFSFSACKNSDSANMVFTEPKEYDGAFSNPMCGFRSGWLTETDGYITTVRDYVPWNAIQKNANSAVQDIIDYTDEKYGDFPARNLRLVPRVYLVWPGSDRINNDEYWPEDMTKYDFSSQEFLDRVTNLVKKMGQAWDNDPRIAYIEMGIYGFWGEHHLYGNKHNLPEEMPENVQKVLGDAFTESFKNKKVQIRYPSQFKDYDFGVYWDSFGHYDEIHHAENILARGDFWKSNVIGGETAYDWGNYKINPGDNPTDTVSDKIHRDSLIYWIRKLHATGLGWVCQYDKTDENALAGAAEIQKAFGYRFIIEKFGHTEKIGSDNNFNAEIVIKNDGSAPFYYDWDLTLSLLDTETLKPVYSTRFDAEISKIYPGDDYNAAKEEYSIPAESHTFKLSATVPENLSGKSYIVAVSINDPSCDKPSIRLACENYINGGYHPLGVVGHNVKPQKMDIEFNDIEEDKTINYSK